MDVWSEIRERYAQGGVTQRELADEYDVPLGSLRRRAAEGNWTKLRSERRTAGLQIDASARHMRLTRQLAITDKLLDIVSQALENPDELYYYVDFQKSSSGSEFIIERLKALNEERLARLVRALGDIFELQRCALGIHEYKDEISARKLEQDGVIASRKLELELIRLEAAQEEGESQDGFLEALGLTGESEALEQVS